MLKQHPFVSVDFSNPKPTMLDFRTVTVLGTPPRTPSGKQKRKRRLICLSAASAVPMDACLLRIRHQIALNPFPPSRRRCSPSQDCREFLCELKYLVCVASVHTLTSSYSSSSGCIVGRPGAISFQFAALRV